MIGRGRADKSLRVFNHKEVKRRSFHESDKNIILFVLSKQTQDDRLVWFYSSMINKQSYETERDIKYYQNSQKIGKLISV